MLALLQFDSPSVPVLERMLEQGRLPILARLRQEGPQVPLEISTDLFEAATYPTLHTGVDVADHGLYSAYQWLPPEQRIRYWHDLPSPPPVWERLARSGRRSLVIDPYQAWPPTVDGGGIWLSGWQFRNRVVVPRWSAPQAAFGSLARRFGGPSGAETVFGRPWKLGLLRIRRALLEAPGRAADLVCDALGRESFELLWITFGAAHLAGHFLWDLSLLNGEMDSESREELETALEDVYSEVDRALDRILAALPDDADVIVFSPDGMGPNCSRTDLLPAMLAAVLGESRSGLRRGLSRPGTAIWRFRGTVPTRLRAGVARAMPASTAREMVTRLQTPPVDWRRTAAFPVPGDCEGFVQLNLRGREREGIVDPDESGALMDQIASGLLSFRDPDGQPAVARVERSAERIAAGARTDQLPDLVVKWPDRPSTRLEGVSSPRFGDVPRRGGGMGTSGNHAEGAWALLLPRSSGVRKLSRAPHMFDVAPTVCASAGVDPTGLVGESLLDPA